MSKEAREFAQGIFIGLLIFIGFSLGSKFIRAYGIYRGWWL